MNVNYNDERFLKVEQEKQNELNQYNQTYDNLIAERDKFTQQQQNYVDEWANKQTQIANDNLEHQIDLYNQQKDKAEKEYQDEAKASYIDYQKEVDKYGVSRENVMNNGLANSGYAESSKVDMYNTYQNRVASARSSLNDIKLEFDNAIKEAQLNNNASLAELALKQMEEKLNIALEGFNYKDAQTQNKLNWQNTINNNYYNRYQDVEDQINYENQQREAIRQYNEQMAYQREQDRLAQQRWEQEMAYQREQDAIANAQRWAQINTSNSVDLSGSSGNSYNTALTKANAAQEKLQQMQQKGNSIINPVTDYSLTLTSREATQFADKLASEILNKNGMNINTFEEKVTSAFNYGILSDKDVASLLNFYGIGN